MMYLASAIDLNATYTCGSVGLEFGGMLPYIISSIVTIIKIIVPVLLIIFGMIDLVKAVTAGKEDEIKKAQNVFIRRLVMGILVFFVVLIVQMLVSFVSNKNANVTKCFNCFINGDATENACKKVD